MESATPPAWKTLIEPITPLTELDAFTRMLQKFNTLTTNVSWAQPYQSSPICLSITPPFEKCVDFHENAKNFIQEIVTKGVIFDNGPNKPRDSVTFVHPHSIEKMQKNFQNQRLNSNIFSQRSTTGVEKFIQEFRDSDRTDIHVFGAASQFNSTEAVNAFVPKCGLAYQFAKDDRTQGPAVQNKNRKIFEVIGAAANFGLNSLSKVLNDELAYNALSNGYLMPNKDQLAAVLNCFTNNGDKMEVTCYHCDGVEVILTAAPATGYNDFIKHNNEQNQYLEQYAAALAYSAQFNRYIDLLQANPEKRLVGHMTGVGLGAFANNPTAVADGFKLAALQFENDLKEHKIDTNRVKVIYEVFEGERSKTSSPAIQFSQKLNLAHNPQLNLHEFDT